MKILSLDVETSPNLAYVWRLFHIDSLTNDKILRASQMICFAAKWIEAESADTETMFFSDFTDGHQSMLERLFDLLDQTDVLVHYNGLTFDEPQCNRELITNGFNPPAPYKRVDLYRTIRSKFAFPSGKLDFVCQELGIGKKAEHEGFELWKGCMANNPDAWATMEAYNRQDAVLNEELYRVLLPWIPGLPSYGADLGQDVCPACGSDDLSPQGYALTKTGRYQRYLCRRCHTWSRASRRESFTRIVQASSS
jgi:hypothetical protein